MPKTSSDSKKRFNKRRFQYKGPRRNERIKAPEVRVVNADGKQLGVMKVVEALKLAKQHSLDLVEISADSRPPVCRIVDYGRYQYEQNKRSKENKPNTAISKVKEVKFRMHIDNHDYLTKLRKAEEFLSKGSKVKMTLMFRGRELQHKHLGLEVLKRATKDLEHISQTDNAPKHIGRHITLMLSPLSKSIQKNLKYNKNNLEPSEVSKTGALKQNLDL